MQVGDLVMLSAYGKARHYNARLLNNESGSNVGLIIEVRTNRSYPYCVRWAKSPKRRHLGDMHNPTHSRMELKYAI